MNTELNLNTVIVEYRNLKVNGIIITYEDLRKMKFEDIPIIMSPAYFMNEETFKMFQNFSDYMIDRTKDLNPVLYDQLTFNWSTKIEDDMKEFFNINMYDEMFDVLKRNVELSIKNRTDEIEHQDELLDE